MKGLQQDLHLKGHPSWLVRLDRLDQLNLLNWLVRLDRMKRMDRQQDRVVRVDRLDRLHRLRALVRVRASGLMLRLDQLLEVRQSGPLRLLLNRSSGYSPFGR